MCATPMAALRSLLHRVLLVLVAACAGFDLTRFLAAGDLATYLGLPPHTAPSTLPTELHLLFVGFSGEGAANVSEPELAPWFQQLRAVLPHAVLPGVAPSTRATYHTPPTALQYATRLHVHRLGPEVTARVEELLAGHLRPEHVGTAARAAGQTLQMNAHTMSALLSSLTRALRLRGFSLFVLHPSVRGSPTYGYRSGYSEAEVAALRASEEASRMLSSASHLLADAHEAHNPKLSQAFLSKPHGAAGKRAGSAAAALPQFSSGDALRERAQLWAGGEAAALLSGVLQPEDGDVEARASEDALLARVSATLVPPKPADAAPAQADDDSAADAHIAAQWHRSQLVAVEEAMRGGAASVGCLTDVWVSSGPLGFIDLAAGPFEWGPVAGGEGVRTTSSLPDLRRLSRPSAPAAGSSSSYYVGSTNEGAGKAADNAQLAAERELLRELTAQACARDNEGPADPDNAPGEPDECEALRARLAAFETYLVDLAAHENDEQQKPKGQPPQQRGPAWAGPLLGHGDGGGAIESHAGMLTDGMLSQLGVAVSLLQEHVLLPPSSPLVRGGGGSHALPYAERVAFQMYVVSNHGAADHADGPEGLALAAFERGMLALRLPSQHFTFTTTHLAMHTDPTLAMAFETSLRHVTLPSVRRNGEISAEEIVYLDSLELAAALRRAAPPPPPVSSAADAQTSRNIPVFFFSTDSPLPLFIDRSHVARAVDGIVLVVQSNHDTWHAPMTCGGAQRAWNLRRPHRAALAATASLLGGLSPPHEALDVRRGVVSHNWLWSVGDSPLAHTSSGVDFGEHFAAVLHRHYVVAALNASAHAAAEAGQLLSEQSTTRGAYNLLQAAADSAATEAVAGAWTVAAEAAAGGDSSGGGGGPPLLRLQAAHAKLQQLQQRVLTLAARKEFDAAARQLHSLGRAADAVLGLAHELAASLAPLSCSQGGRGTGRGGAARASSYWRGPLAWILGVASLAAMLPLCALATRRRWLPAAGRRGPKVNLD